MRKSIIMGVLASTLALPACGGEDDPPADPTPTGPITLRLATGDAGDGLTPYRNVIAAFEAENPGITIEVESVTGDYYSVLMSAAIDGSSADIILLGEDALGRFAEDGVVEPLDGYFADPEASLDPSIYLPGVYRPGAWAGAQYLLPKDYSTIGVYYNKELFDAAGLPYPQAGWTWDDFRQTAEALTDAAAGQYGVHLPANWPRGFEYWAAAAGGKLISDDGTQIQGHLDSAAVAQAMQFYVDLYAQGVAAPPTDLTAFGGGEDHFAAGNAAMRVFGRWPQSGYLADAALGDAIGVAPPPAGLAAANVIAWAGFGIYSRSEHKEAAWRFLRYLAGPEGSREFASWGLPAVASVAEELGLAEDPIEGAWLAGLQDLAPIAAFASPYWGVTGEPEVYEALTAAIQDPSADVAALLQAAATAAQTALDAQLAE